jgi:hypothetical protein
LERNLLVFTAEGFHFDGGTSEKSHEKQPEAIKDFGTSCAVLPSFVSIGKLLRNL